MGSVTPPVTEGTVSPTPPAFTAITPEVTIGGIPAKVTFSGLTPSSVGLYQINAIVPPNVPRGGAVPVVVAIGGQTSQRDVTIAIQ